MPATTKVPLGAATLNRMYYLDVDTTPDAAATWVAVNGIKEFKPNFESDLQDDSDFDSNGYKSSTKTAEAWSLETTIVRKVTAADETAYDPGQEFLRDHSVGKMGNAARVHVRFYEMTEDGPREEAYDGYASVGWAPSGGTMETLNEVEVVLTGQGKLNAITHPDA